MSESNSGAPLPEGFVGIGAFGRKSASETRSLVSIRSSIFPPNPNLHAILNYALPETIEVHD